MLLKLMNLIAGLFGYQWVIDNSVIAEHEQPILEADDWDDLQQSSTSYKLQKINPTASDD